MLGVPYFFQKEAEYEAWLDEYGEIGLVVNNFTNKYGTKFHENGLKLHKADCASLNKAEYKGRRTNYGKLCGLDELALVEDCERRTGSQPKRSQACCFKSVH